MQQKLKICSVCKEPSVLWTANPKMCKDCAGKARANTNVGNPRFKERAKSTDQVEFNKAVTVFFLKQVLKMPRQCENCNAELGRPMFQTDKREFVAHILPKKKNFGGFPSVATNEDNVMFLGTRCGCHPDWDSNGDKRKAMVCYPMAIERFNKFKHLLTPKELQAAYTYLKIDFQ